MILNLRPGHLLTTVRPLTRDALRHWRYGADCAPLNADLGAGTVLRVVEVSHHPGHLWARAALADGRILKISGEELGLHLRRWR